MLVASLVLGGGTRAGILSDTILQIVAVPALLVALWKAAEAPWAKPTQIAFLLWTAILVVPAVQLIPLPPWLWTALPSREAGKAPFEILGSKIPWMPISAAPDATWLSGLSLLPPLAIFLGTLVLAPRERREMSLIIIALGVVSAFLGLVQVAQGPSSPLRFFDITNLSEAVGFFANRNHFAALLYAALLFAAAWAVDIAASEGPKLTQIDRRAVVLVLGGFVVLVILLSGQAMTRSRAGVGLTIIALLGALALGFSDRRTVSRAAPAKMVLAAASCAILFSTQYALYRFLERFEADPLEDARIAFARNTFAAAKAYMPFGSGLGSFVSVYGMFEKPQDTMADTFANHAHNDILELWLETGAVGVVLLALFAIWFIWRAVAIWREAPQSGLQEIDRLLPRAATIVIALLFAHSFVDYPLRTEAMMAVMAFSCALLLAPPVRRGVAAYDLPERSANAALYAEEVEALLAVRAAAPARHVDRAPKPAQPMTVQGSSTGDRWGADIDWPEPWRQSANKRSARSHERPAGKLPDD